MAGGEPAAFDPGAPVGRADPPLAHSGRDLRDQPPPPPLERGCFRARLTTDPEDLARARALRGLAFRRPGPDGDAFDATCRHLLVEDRRDGALVCCARVMPLAGAEVASLSYAGQHYGLAALSATPGPMLELGRFCLHPARTEPDILRLAWGALTAYVDALGVRMLFGCASFPGTDPAPYAAAFAQLAARHLAPPLWRPEARAPAVYRFAAAALPPVAARAAGQAMPPLLRSYLGMGGRVSDHAVVDAEMNTLHVFTGVEIAAIPAARQRLLRAVVGA